MKKNLSLAATALAFSILTPLGTATSAAAQEVPASTPPAAGQAAPGAGKPADAKEKDKNAFGEMTKDVITPDAPGFVALGIAQNDVVHPESPKRLAVGLLNGLDQNGNFQNGVAFQFSPALLFAGDDISNYRYNKNRALQRLTRLEIMAAVAKGSGDDKAARAALGFTWRLFDTGDPYTRRGLLDCFSEIASEEDVAPDEPAQTPSTGGTKPSGGGVATPGTSAPKRKTVAECREQNLPSRFGAHSLQVGFAPLFVSASGKTDEFRSKGFAANAVLSVGLNRLFYGADIQREPEEVSSTKPGERKVPAALRMTRGALLVIGATYRKEEPVPDPANKGKFIDRDRFNIGGRLLFGSLKSALFGGEVLYQRASYEGGLGRDNYITYTATADIKIGENLWLGLALGGASGNRVAGNQGFIGTRMRWGLGAKAAPASQFKE
jgi:hypothetical protein